ncbi:MAG TPA: hypothetical protein VFQ91_23770 [Bryobacteraceae bacterium]|nr:hypothetical protein [Bryobacteraceae bacterium]
MRIFLLAILAIGALAGETPAKEPVQELAVGDALPPLRGSFLTGKAATLPEAANGRPALLLLGFTYDSRFAVEAWAKAFRASASGGSAVLFEVPVISGMARMGRWFIESGMRRGTPKEDHEHVITVYGNADAWKKRVGFQDPQAAYLLLLDAKGHVVWRHQGGYSEQGFASLTRALDSLRASHGGALRGAVLPRFSI